jgi:arginyl-tRNA synthetase
MNSFEQVQSSFYAFLQKTFSLGEQDIRTCSFELNTQENKQQFGDISSNACMILAKKMGTSPRELAAQVIEKFSHPLVEKIEIAGPGFLNFYLTKEAFTQVAMNLLEQKHGFFRPSTPHSAPHYSIEFVSANPTGPLHLGHGRGGIIGDVLGNVVTFLTYPCTKEYYINDAGSQMDRLAQSLKIRCLQILGDPIAMPEDAYHGEYMIDLAKMCVAQHGEATREKELLFFKTYAQEHLLEMIKKTLKDYGISFDVWFSEKTLHTSGAIEDALNILTERGFTYTQDGALWFRSTQFGDDKDRVLRKQDGSFTYAAADVAYVLNKLKRGATKLVFVLGQDHHSYGVRLKGIIQALGHSADMLDVILYQLVTIKESDQVVRMSKRAGNFVTLNDVIEATGTDVARFFYLNRKADAHLEFDIALALKDTEENPVYYLQYAYIRTKSILAKANEHASLAAITARDIAHTELNADERLLLKKISSLKEMLNGIATHYQTHLLTYYTLELAQLFHRYYGKHRIIDANAVETSRTRLALTSAVHDTLSLCLTLIGVSLPEKM